MNVVLLFKDSVIFSSLYFCIFDNLSSLFSINCWGNQIGEKFILLMQQ